jgi:hypothetical protein
LNLFVSFIAISSLPVFEFLISMPGRRAIVSQAAPPPVVFFPFGGYSDINRSALTAGFGMCAAA